MNVKSKAKTDRLTFTEGNMNWVTADASPL